MNTAFALMAVHGQALLPLEDVGAQYLGISDKEARRRAGLNTLPFPTMRLMDSQKAPLFVRLEDLARYIDDLAETARSTWERSAV
ncbi:hypothetical protein HNQ50_002577 [Silvimonas terrae]|uniref:Pyocin activator protein PrtN n=1 Tax=Silvimonas terrae TaxID=300266 RepID=A0A840RFN3_9NEIS|nr:pyocin activator PrtN family protein [Silvimonas terrae]MBB5191847.1 hypothetical protein [Silvimonas terrae]